MSVRKHRKIGGRYHWSNCLLFDYEFLLRWMTAGYSSLTFNQPCLFVFCVCKFRLFLQVFAEGILNGILGVLLTAKYHNADPVQHLAVFPYCRFQVHIFPSPSYSTSVPENLSGYPLAGCCYTYDTQSEDER